MNRNLKKIIAIISCAVITTSTIVGCSSNSASNTEKKGDITYNKEYLEDELVNLKGEKINKDNSVILPNMGFAVDFTEFKDLKDSENLGVGLNNSNTMTFSFTTDKGIKLLKETNMALLNSDREEMDKFMEKYSGENIDLCIFIRVPKDDPDKLIEVLEKEFDSKEEVLKLENETYYFLYNKKIDTKNIEDKEKEKIDYISKNIDTLKNSICIFDRVIESDEEKGTEEEAVDDDRLVKEGGNMRDFNAKTMSGKNFTQENLKDYDITMVNLWTTWCGYCIDEMPHLQELYKKLPKNVNLISICDDANEEPEFAKEIVDKYKLEFETLIPDEKLQKSISEYITAYPTTILVDKEGNIVGNVQVGVPTNDKDKIVDAYMGLINEALNKVNK